MTPKVDLTLVQHLRFVVGAWKDETQTDKELLRRFVQTRDERAFTTLVGRHSKLVWNVCFRILQNAADAEDALQATFLRLSLKSKRIVNQESLSAWLFRVARDCSIDLQRSILRQRRIAERVADLPIPSEDRGATDNLLLHLDEELELLPQRERAVFIICCLEGRTYTDAAVELGCSTATVHRWFVSARTRLRRRLATNPAASGALSCLLLGGMASTGSAANSGILARTVEAGLSAARTGVLPAGRTAALALGTTSGGLKIAGMTIGAMSAVIALVAFVCSTLTTPRQSSAPFPETRREAAAKPAEPKPSPRSVVTGVIRGPLGQPVAGAVVAAMARRPFGPAERGLRDKVVATTMTDADGRFALNVPEDFETWFPDRTVTLQASGANLSLATLPVHLHSLTEPVELKLASATPRSGKLLDEAGSPAVGVRVEVVRIGDAVGEPVVGEVQHANLPAWPDAVTSGPDGKFVIPCARRIIECVGSRSRSLVRARQFFPGRKQTQ